MIAVSIARHIFPNLPPHASEAPHFPAFLLYTILHPSSSYPKALTNITVFVGENLWEKLWEKIGD
jgi:hypothetical protein